MRVALVHDYLTQYGGAERVLETLHEMFPGAPVYTSFLDLDSLPAQFRGWQIQTSQFQRLPRSERYHRALLPLYPVAFRSFTKALRSFDLVIADSSAWSHGVQVGRDATLVCYCHSPARFLYRDTSYLSPARLPPIAAPITPPLFAALRRHDRNAARRVDRYIANSQNVQGRIKAVYGRDAAVIYPPVDTARFVPRGSERDPESWYLVVSRLVPHKRVELAIDACNVLGRPLKVIGSGRSFDELRRRAGSTIEFLGALSDADVIDHLQRCQALILPAAEDLGMTAIEVQAAGRPVIAFGEGGARETVVDGTTGLLFHEPTTASLVETIERFEARRWLSQAALDNAVRFDTRQFKEQFLSEVNAAIEKKRRGSLDSRC